MADREKMESVKDFPVYLFDACRATKWERYGVLSCIGTSGNAEFGNVRRLVSVEYGLVDKEIGFGRLVRVEVPSFQDHLAGRWLYTWKRVEEGETDWPLVGKGECPCPKC